MTIKMIFVTLSLSKGAHGPQFDKLTMTGSP